MTSILDKLNLRPNERRLVVGIGLVVFAVINFIFVYPQFSEWGKLRRRMDDIDNVLLRFEREINKVPQYQRQLAELKRLGADVATEAQALELNRTIYSEAAKLGGAVSISGYSSPRGSSGRTNQFFEEHTGVVPFVAEEAGLVTFLNNLSHGGSLIRVSSMTLAPDPARQKLAGSITFIASYPRRPPIAKSAPAASGRTTAGAVSNAPARSMSQTLAGTRPAATNAPATTSWWTKVKGWFSKSPSTNAPATTNTTAAAARTNAPAIPPPPRR